MVTVQQIMLGSNRNNVFSLGIVVQSSGLTPLIHLSHLLTTVTGLISQLKTVP